MKKPKFFSELSLKSYLLLIVCCFCAKEKGIVSSKPDVHNIFQLNSRQLEQAQSRDSDIFWLVKFCRRGHSPCDRIISNFITLAESFKDKTTVKFGEIDCVKNDEICTANSIKSVPTLNLYYRGAVAQHAGKYDVDSLKQWVSDRLNDSDIALHPFKQQPFPSPSPLPSSSSQGTKTAPPKGQPLQPSLPSSKYITLLDREGLALAHNDPAENFWVIKYTQSNCSHCVEFAQTYVDLANFYAKKNTQLKFGEINCDLGPYCYEEHITGVPALRMYYKTHHSDYVGERRLSLITTWVEENTADEGNLILHPPRLESPLVRVFEEAEDYRKVVERETEPGSEVFWVMRFSSQFCLQCKILAPLYVQLAEAEAWKSNADLKFGSVDCGQTKGICDAEEVVVVPTVKILYKGKKLVYDGEPALDQLTPWLEASIADNGNAIVNPPRGGARPPPPGAEYIEMLNRTTLGEVQGKGSAVFWVVKYYRHACPPCKHLEPIYVSLAESLSDTDSLRFGQVDCFVEAALCNANRLEGVPTIRMYYKGSYIEYDGDGVRTVDAFTEWIAQNMADDGDKILHPAPSPPSHPASKYVSELNALSLESAQAASNTDFWVVKFYRHGCPHCKRLEPDFVALADRLGPSDDIKFGQVDCPASGNLCKENNVKGVPTLRIYYRGEFLEYNGKRDVSSMNNWVDAAIANDGDMIVSSSTRNFDL